MSLKPLVMLIQEGEFKEVLFNVSVSCFLMVVQKWASQKSGVYLK